MTNSWARVHGQVGSGKGVIDPYAPLIKGRACFGVRDEFERFQEKACPVPEVTRLKPVRLRLLSAHSRRARDAYLRKCMTNVCLLGAGGQRLSDEHVRAGRARV